MSPGWAEDASEDKIKEWSKRGIELVKEEMERVAEETCAVEYGRHMHKVRAYAIPLFSRRGRH